METRKESKEKKKDLIAEIKALIREYFILKYGPVCQLCDEKFSNTNYLITCHLLTQGAYPNLKYEIYNIIWACNECHKKLDLFDDPVILDRVIKLKGFAFKLKLQRISQENGKIYLPAIRVVLKKELKKLKRKLKKDKI